MCKAQHRAKWQLRLYFNGHHLATLIYYLLILPDTALSPHQQLVSV